MLIDDNIDYLVADLCFRIAVRGLRYHVVLMEDYPQFWPLQKHLLLALQYALRKLPTDKCTIVIPGLLIQQSTAITKALLRLTRIRNIHEGIQIWMEYLAKNNGSVEFANKNCDVDMSVDLKGPRKQSLEITQVMTELVQLGLPASELSFETGDQLKYEIIRTAEMFLCRQMDSMPLDFVIYNFESLMKTAWNSTRKKPSIGMTPASARRVARVLLTNPNNVVSLIVGRYIECERTSSLVESHLSTHWLCWAAKSEKSTSCNQIWRDDGREQELWQQVEVAVDIAPRSMRGDLIRRLLLPPAIHIGHVREPHHLADSFVLICTTML